MKGKLSLVLIGVVFLICSAYAEEQPAYVGSKACAECHQNEYDNWQKYAKKAHSYKSIERMKHDLRAEDLRGCYECHTTGYGDPSGFKDPVSTPDLRNVGCEACHGPGSVHVETNDPADIKTDITMQDCMKCHINERITAFRFKPLVHAGAH